MKSGFHKTFFNFRQLPSTFFKTFLQHPLRNHPKRPKMLATSAARNDGNGVGSGFGRIIGSGVAGISELVAFHPVDTVAKRLMTYQGRALGNLNVAIFEGYADSSIFVKYRSLFPGIGFGAAYKVLQRIYKFGGQPFVNKYINDNFSSQISTVVGQKYTKTLIYATAGSIMGVGEIILLPLDVLKIKAQTNKEALKGRGVFAIFAEEGLNLYKGWGWTAARNAPGSFALFGGSAFMKEYVFGLTKYSDATFLVTYLTNTHFHG